MKFPPNMLHSGNLRLGIASVAALGLLVAIPASAQAATAPVPLGTAGSFVVLAGAGITNTGNTTLNGDIGTFPNPAITGLSTMTLNGANHAADAVDPGRKDRPGHRLHDGVRAEARPPRSRSSSAERR